MSRRFIVFVAQVCALCRKVLHLKVFFKFPGYIIHQKLTRVHDLLILKNSSLLSLNQFFSLKELLIFNTLIFHYKVLKKNEIKISTLKQKMGIGYAQNKNIKEVLAGLSVKKDTLKYVNKAAEQEQREITYFEALTIEDNTVKFRFSKDILEYIDVKNSSFYTIDFKNLLKIGKVHSITIYELILDFTLKNKKETTLYFNFNFLRKILGLENKYVKNSEFKKKVVEKIIDNLNEVENVNIRLLEKNKQFIVKIVSKNTSKARGEEGEIQKWLSENEDELELYKETLVASNDKIDSKEIEFHSIKKQGRKHYVVFKYQTFLLDVEIIQEDLDAIFKKERNTRQNA